MSGGYKVDIAELGQLIQALEDAADDVRDANKKLAEAGEFEKLGDSRLGYEAQEFEDKWEHGLEKLDEAAEGVVERLDIARKSYQELEEEYEDFLGEYLPDENGSGSPGAGGGSGGMPGGAAPAADAGAAGGGGGSPSAGGGGGGMPGGGAAAVPPPSSTLPADAEVPVDIDTPGETEVPDAGMNPITGTPLETDPETGDPYPIDPETGEAITDIGNEQNVVTITEGDNTISMLEPDDQGRMKISIDDGHGTQKNFTLDFAAGEGSGDGDLGGSGAGGIRDDFGPGGGMDDPGQGHRPGPDGKIHIEDGDLKITAQQPEGADGPTVVTVDDGSGDPTTYTLGEDAAGGETGTGSPAGGVRPAEGAQGNAERQLRDNIPMDTAQTSEAGSEPESVEPMSSPTGEFLAEEPRAGGAEGEFRGDVDAGELFAGGIGDETTPSADGFGAASGIADWFGESATDTEAHPWDMAQSAAVDAGVGTAPGGTGDWDSADSQQDMAGGGMPMMAGMGGGAGGGGEDQDRSAAYRIATAIFDIDDDASRISGSLQGEVSSSIRYQW